MKIKIILLSLFAVISVGHASITVQFQGGNFSDKLGAALLDGALGAVVADTTGAGFSGLTDGSLDLVGSTLSVGQTLGSSNVSILGLVAASDIGTGAGGFADTFSVTYTGGLAQGDNLGFYWFPTLTSVGGSVGNSVDYGFYRSDTVDVNAGADIAFVAPVDGFSYSLFTFDSSIDGSAPNASAFQAAYTTAVPEPYSFALLAGCFGLAWVMVRRRS